MYYGAWTVWEFLLEFWEFHFNVSFHGGCDSGCWIHESLFLPEVLIFNILGLLLGTGFGFILTAARLTDCNVIFDTLLFKRLFQKEASRKFQEIMAQAN